VAATERAQPLRRLVLETDLLLEAVDGEDLRRRVRAALEPRADRGETSISITTAARSSPGLSEVRSVESLSGSIGNTNGPA
jgi:hypothetical protein